MENVSHKSLENTAGAELTAESTETEPWDSIGVSSKNIIVSASQCSEEHVLKGTFNACDPEQTGEVSVFRIIEYLQEVTGQTCEDWRVQSLYTRLDPEERGVAVDFPTFHRVMKDWIADCRQDGEEVVDLMNSIEDLQQGNKQLAVQNIKLQKTIECAEELNVRLSEEIAELKRKLRGTQQAQEQARLVANELENLKFFSKTLEEENSKLHSQSRQLEKEQQLLLNQVESLKEENRKLLLEKETSKNKLRQLCTEKAKMKSQLCECENLISCKDTALDKKEKQTEELTVTLAEYQMMVQELKLEVISLQKQLCHSHEYIEVQRRNSLENMKTCIQASAQPLSTEIEESQKQGFDDDDDLPSPLCGTLPSFVTHGAVPEEFRAMTEDMELNISKADMTETLLQRTHRLSYLSLVADAQSILKNQESSQQQKRTLELVESMKEPKQVSLASEQGGNSSRLGVTPKSCRVGTCSDKMGTPVLSELGDEAVCTNRLEITAVGSAEHRSEPAPEEQALVPVHHKQMPAGGKKPYNKSFERLTEWLLDVPLVLLHILQKLVFLGFLACVSLLVIIYFVPPYGHHPIWIESRGNPWPRLQLQYLRPPPI